MHFKKHNDLSINACSAKDDIKKWSKKTCMSYLSMRKKKVLEKLTEMKKETLNQRSVADNSIEENSGFRTRSLIALAYTLFSQETNAN